MVQESANSAGVLRNTATVAAAQATPTPPTETSTATTTVRLSETRLEITKTPGFGRVGVGGTITYRIRVHVVGAVAGAGVRACDRLSPYLAVSSAPGARDSAGLACWTIAQLKPGQAHVFTLTVIARNVAAPLRAPDTATAIADNAPAVDVHAAVEIRPRTRPPAFTG
jgi:uncharacterized membrane protein